MISFVWSDPGPLVPGAGGTETFTLGQCRELTRRGIANQIITFGLGKNDGREYSPDVLFTDYASPREAGVVQGDVVFITNSVPIKTQKTPSLMMHCHPIMGIKKEFYKAGYNGRRLITNSQHSARVWSDYLSVDNRDIAVMYPFAHNAFGEAKATTKSQKKRPIRVLFAGRLTVEKGFYTLLEALHFFTNDPQFTFTATSIGKGHPLLGPQRKIIESLAHAHPQITVIPGCSNPREMAALLASHDIVAMPSHSVLWPEPFGMLSVEAQHSGCRVVASNIGGLPETDCGGLHLFEPDNPIALADTIRYASKMGRLSQAARCMASKKFTVAQSVDRLLDILQSDGPVYRMLRTEAHTPLRMTMA